MRRRHICRLRLERRVHLRRIACRRTCERFAQCMEHELMNRTRIAEPDLDLGRMNVHVHACGIELEKEDVTRVPLVMQHVRVRLPDRVSEQAVSHEAAIYEGVLSV